MAVVARELQGCDPLTMGALIPPQTLPRLHSPHLQGAGAQGLNIAAGTALTAPRLFTGHAAWGTDPCRMEAGCRS